MAKLHLQVNDPKSFDNNGVTLTWRIKQSAYGCGIIGYTLILLMSLT